MLQLIWPSLTQWDWIYLGMQLCLGELNINNQANLKTNLNIYFWNAENDSYILHKSLNSFELFFEKEPFIFSWAVIPLLFSSKFFEITSLKSPGIIFLSLTLSSRLFTSRDSMCSSLPLPVCHLKLERWSSHRWLFLLRSRAWEGGNVCDYSCYNNRISKNMLATNVLPLYLKGNLWNLPEHASWPFKYFCYEVASVGKRL